MFILDFGHSKQSSVYLTEHDFLIYPEFKRKFYFNEYEIVNRNRDDWNQVLNTYSSYFSYFENIFSLIMNNSWLTKADSDNSLNRETRTARKMKENMVKISNSLLFQLFNNNYNLYRWSLLLWPKSQDTQFCQVKGSEGEGVKIRRNWSYERHWRGWWTSSCMGRTSERISW